MPGRGDAPASGFGPRLKTVRESKGWSQKQLGEAAEVHPNTIAKLERSDQEPNWPLVLKLAKALGVDCTAFAGADVEGDISAPEPIAAKPAKNVTKKPKGKK